MYQELLSLLFVLKAQFQFPDPAVFHSRISTSASKLTCITQTVIELRPFRITLRNMDKLLQLLTATTATC